MDRCPNAIIKDPFIQRALELYSWSKKGITPNNRGIRFETACYRDMMNILEAYADRAESWWQKKEEDRIQQESKVKKKNSGSSL